MPVLAYRRGSMPELVVDGVSGALVDGLEEAVGAVAKTVDGVDRARCRDYAVGQFGRGAMVAGYERVYAAL